MKNLILILALVIGSVSFAQNKMEKKSVTAEKSGATIDQKVERLTQELDLSSEQQMQLKSILVKRKDMVKKNQGNTERINEINKTTRATIKKILTPEQLKKLEEMKKERKTLKKATKKAAVDRSTKKSE